MTELLEESLRFQRRIRHKNQIFVDSIVCFLFEHAWIIVPIVMAIAIQGCSSPIRPAY